MLNADDYPLYAQLQPGDLYASGHIRDAATGTRGSWSELIVIARSPADAQLLAQEMQPTVRQFNGEMTTSGVVMRLAMTYLPKDSNPGSGPLLIRVIGDDNAMTAFMSLWSPDPAGLVPPPTG